MVSHIDGPLVKFFEGASDETCSALVHHHSCGCRIPTQRVLSTECAKLRAPLKVPDHVDAHARQVWISSTTYDFWIIWGRLKILQKRLPFSAKNLGPFYRGKISVQTGGAGTPAHRAIAAYCLRQTAPPVRQLILQLLDIANIDFKTLHYNSVSCCDAAGFFTRRACSTSL